MIEHDSPNEPPFEVGQLVDVDWDHIKGLAIVLEISLNTGTWTRFKNRLHRVVFFHLESATIDWLWSDQIKPTEVPDD